MKICWFSLDPSDPDDIHNTIWVLQQFAAILGGTGPRPQVLQEILELDSARLLRLAFRHFGTEQFRLPELARKAGETLGTLHGLAGALGIACNNRHVQVFDRHGGKPLILSVRPEVAALLAAEPDAPRTAAQSPAPRSRGRRP